MSIRKTDDVSDASLEEMKEEFDTEFDTESPAEAEMADGQTDGMLCTNVLICGPHTGTDCLTNP